MSAAPSGTAAAQGVVKGLTVMWERGRGGGAFWVRELIEEWG